jgi:mRNA-degrading endonuclease HigB of HigAB toxin-antitoxin module
LDHIVPLEVILVFGGDDESTLLECLIVVNVVDVMLQVLFVNQFFHSVLAKRVMAHHENDFLLSAHYSP